MKTLSDSVKIVMVDPSRGWDAGFYEILERRGDEIKIRRRCTTADAKWIYAAHTYSNAETISYQKKFMIERAEKIGKRV